MRSKGRWALSVIGSALVILLSFPPTPTHAQIVPGWDFSVSVFGGGAIPFATDADATNLPTVLVAPPFAVFGTGTGTFHDVQLNSSFSFGGKAAAWTEGFRSATGLDFGLEIDATHFTPSADGQTVTASGQFTSGGVTVFGSIPFMIPSFDINATIVAVNLLARWPIYQSPSFPNGRVQWYLGAGVGAEMATLKISGAGSEGDTALAIQALAGGKAFLTRNVALFVEYKFTHASHSWNFQSTKIEADLDVSHVVGGLAFHF